MIDVIESGLRPYRSGAFASARSFTHGRFEAEIRAAPGSGLITGFFLHRDAPRQEIDIEFAGADPRRMLANVYFNPGDDGTAMGFGYRGSPCRIDLGFDATADFHLYAIDWRPHCVSWLVDGKVVHERFGWDPTPIPHLSMRLHANLWAPRSEELAGRLDERGCPARCLQKRIRPGRERLTTSVKGALPVRGRLGPGPPPVRRMCAVWIGTRASTLTLRLLVIRSPCATPDRRPPSSSHRRRRQPVTGAAQIVGYNPASVLARRSMGAAIEASIARAGLQGDLRGGRGGASSEVLAAGAGGCEGWGLGGFGGVGVGRRLFLM